MRTQKRNKIDRAFIKGYQAGSQSRSISACPYHEHSNIRHQWIKGWREGRADSWAGLSDVSTNAKAMNQ